MSSLSEARSAKEVAVDNIGIGLFLMGDDNFGLVVYVPDQIDGVPVVIRPKPTDIVTQYKTGAWLGPTKLDR